ncbi:MAG: hypothetical protein AAF675_08980 [Pseudomonadota bacterium]
MGDGGQAGAVLADIDPEVEPVSIHGAVAVEGGLVEQRQHLRLLPGDGETDPDLDPIPRLDADPREIERQPVVRN